MAKYQRDYEIVEVDINKYTEEELRGLVPAKVYKYYSVNKYFFKALEANELWFSNPLDFNDPFDCSIKLNFGDNKEELEASAKILFKDNPDMQKLIIEKLTDDGSGGWNMIFNQSTQMVWDELLGVCCFTEFEDNPLMWAHYANSHLGVCLEFNAKGSTLNDKLIPVMYTSEYPNIKLKDFGEERLFEFYANTALYKSVDWVYEREWRYCITTGGRVTKKFDKNDLTGIIFGLRTTKRNRNKIIRMIKEHNYPNVIFYQADLHMNKFEMIIEPIEIN